LTEYFVQRDNLTTFMVTHNMKDAIHYGNRLIMMLDGQIVYEASGEEKKNLQVKDLLEKFQTAGGEESVPDKMILG
ncbi:MAG: ABC transporter ATP-binding protein, partial [Treponema sp.]|nr:ABC transporter ATP-binding protein [Treponema sp.]